MVKLGKQIGQSYGTLAGQPCFRVYRDSSTQSLANNTVTVVDMNATLFDVLGNFNLTTDLFTAPIAGKYYFNFQWISGASTLRREISTIIRQNGSQYAQSLVQDIATISRYSCGQVSCILNMAVNDTADFCVKAYDYDGAGTMVVSYELRSTYAEGYLIG